MYTAIWIGLLIGGSWAGYNAYCAFKARSDARELEAAVDEFNNDQRDTELAHQAWLRERSLMEHPKRIDDTQWRDWN